MSKTLFKRALSLTAAAFMGIMATVSQMPPVQASAAPADISVNAAATVPAVTTTLLALDRFSFNPNIATIKTGEEITVELLNAGSDERWEQEELPEFSIGDPEVVSVEKGEETGTFIVKGLSMGSTFVRFFEIGYGDFIINVTDENGELVTQTNEAVTTVTTLPAETAPSDTITTDPEYLPMDTTTAPLDTVPTTTAPAETVTSLHSIPQTTTTTAGIVLKCEPSYVQIKEGQSIMVELYCEPDSVPYSGDFPTVIINDETIASTSPCDFPRGFYINGLSVGGTYAEISVDFMGEVLTAELPIDVLPKNVNTDITDNTSTTFTTTADPFGNTVTLPTTTAPINTVTTTTTAPTGETVTSLQSTTEFTTTSTGLELRCEPNYVQVNVNAPNSLNGLKRVDIYLGSEVLSPDSVKASVEDESIAGLIAAQDNKGFYVEGKAVGSTYAEFTVTYNGEELTAILPIDVLPEEPNLDATTTLPTSTTTATPNSSTGTVPTFTTTPNSSTGTVPTFTTTAVTSSTSATPEPPVSDKTGDVNNDGTVDLADATNVLNIYACMAAGMEIAFENADAADINGDGKVDTTDAAYILTYYANKSAGIPCTWEDII